MPNLTSSIFSVFLFTSSIDPLYSNFSRAYEPLPTSDLAQNWCFLARTLAGIDPFDASRWTSSLLYPQNLLQNYVCAPEFYPSYFDWIKMISEHSITHNTVFIFDVDGLTRLFIVLKLFGRYGTYLPELIFFGWLIYLLVTQEHTSKTFKHIMTTIQLCIFIAALTTLLPFAPTELFTGYKADGYSELIKLIFLILVLFYFSAISVWEFLGTAKKEIYIIMIFFLFFSLVMISCSNLWIFFFALEGISFCTIAFFVFNFSGQGHISDAIRYFCLNAIASGALMLSLGLGEYVTNTADYNDFEAFFLLNSTITSVPNSFSLAVILFLIGSLFKLGIFPFNIYEVDTYKKASYIVIYFSSVVTKIPFFFVWLKLVWRVIPFIKTVFPILFVFGLLTAVIGTIGASFQTVLRPFLTYSSMSHTGLILVSFTTETLLGIDTACLYFLAYIIAMSIIYMILNALEAMAIDMHGVHQLRELRAQFSLACCFTLSILSLAGFPLTIGFFAKIGLLVNLALMGQVWLVILILVLNLISFSYYLRIIKVIWIEVGPSSALQYALTDMKKIQKAAVGRTFFAAQLLSTLLVISVLALILSFKFIVLLSSTLLCVAIYSVDWWFFIRTMIVGLKNWLFFSTSWDASLMRLVQFWDKTQRINMPKDSWNVKSVKEWLWPERTETMSSLLKRYNMNEDLVRAVANEIHLKKQWAKVEALADYIRSLQSTHDLKLKLLQEKGFEAIVNHSKKAAEEGEALRDELRVLIAEIQRAQKELAEGIKIVEGEQARLHTRASPKRAPSEDITTMMK
jgi:NADH-quinone oxidoreductase subunit N